MNLMNYLGSIFTGEDMVREVKEKLILHWNYRGFTELPDVIRKYGSHIQEVYLKWNQISNLPLWIPELTNITNLYLHGNQIATLPDELGQMIQLHTLDLGQNKLNTLPQSIGRLKNLRILLLNSNCMRIVPPEISQLKRLETLSVSGNELIALPEWLGSLRHLEELNADCNSLIEIPNSLTLAPQLSTISVCSNRLQYLPLNGFLSSPCIQFDCNRDLNYLSIPVRYQLGKQNCFFRDATDILAYRCSDGTVSKVENDKVVKLNIRLKVATSTQETTIVVLPRQLLVVYDISNNHIPSLWELALRQVYCNRFKHILDISYFTIDVRVKRTERRILDKSLEITGYMNDLLKNGPTSICLAKDCQHPIFTEAWIALNSYSKNPFLQLSVFCSRRCGLKNIEITGASVTNHSWCIL